MNIQKCVAGTEASGDALNVIINKALGFPKIGTHRGGGRRVTMPGTWDGSGPTPPGWTRQATANWVNTALDAAVLIPDSMVTELQRAESLARLSPAEITTLNAALAIRADKDLDAGNYVPKALAAAQLNHRAV